MSLPNYKEVKRYYDLGGRILTMGTDSHNSSSVGQYIDETISMYQNIVFKM
jgi:hypothetical protein